MGLSAKRIPAFILSLAVAVVAALAVGLVPGAAPTAHADGEPVPYMAWDEAQGKLVEKTGDYACAKYKVVTKDTEAFENSIESGNWYVVNADVTINQLITVTGTANLILVDGKTLTASRGIEVSSGQTLNIYAQSEGSAAGALSITGVADNRSGIGSSSGYDGGAVSIHGGKITATGGDGGAGIGGGRHGDGGNVSIYGGEVTATGGVGGAGIGGGFSGIGVSGGDGGNVSIYGGEVTATGGDGGAGIGGGNGGKGGAVSIHGGEVTATGGDGGAVSIDGGKVIATGGDGGYGIGHGNGGGSIGSLEVATTHVVYGSDSAIIDKTASGVEKVPGTGAVFTNGLFNPKQYMLVAPHEHDFTYSASGATITATCADTDGLCTLDDGTEQHNHVATLTIAKPTLATYGQTGDGISAEATVTDENGLQGEAKVKYQTKSGGDYKEATETAPTSAGSHMASVTLEGVKTAEGAGESVTASVEYTIAKADPVAVAPKDLTATYGHTLSAVTLENPQDNTPGTWAWADGTQDVGGVVSPPAAFKANFTPKDPANYNTVSGVDVPVTVTKADISDAQVTLAQTSYTFDNREKTPETKVALVDGKELTEGVDYDVTYEDNVYIGTAKVTVTGKGNCEGTAEATFTIKAPIPTPKPTPAPVPVPTPDAKAPSIDSQPQDLSWDEGDDTPRTLKVVASAPDRGALTYQWYRDGEPIEGATGAEYAIPDPGEAPSGTSEYYCIVTNKKNGKTSTTKSGTVKVTVNEASKPDDPVNPDDPGKPDDPDPYEGMTDEEKAGADELAAAFGADKAAAAEMLKAGESLGASVDTMLLTADAIASLPGDGDPAGTDFAKLTAKSPESGKRSLTYEWKAVPGADGYLVYSAKCGKAKMKLKKAVAAGAAGSIKLQGLKKGAYYKAMVVAYKEVAGQRLPIAASVIVRSSTVSKDYTDAKAVKVGQKRMSVAAGSSVKVEAKVVKRDKDKAIKRYRAVRYESLNPAVAKVGKKSGKVTGVSAGTTAVYAYAQNGVFKKVRVTVTAPEAAQTQAEGAPLAAASVA